MPVTPISFLKTSQSLYPTGRGGGGCYVPSTLKGFFSQEYFKISLVYHLDKGGHEAHLDAVLLDEGVLVVLPQLHDVGHVQLVEGRQHRVRVLRLLQARSDLQPHPVHLHSKTRHKRYVTSIHCRS
jgi:hypothetical protein